ncbi:MAG TPA: sensor histidine kinase [Gemmatimonadaceae bacterium]|nr:sensor histidine kinase [Gemmatimonadaceae bacterium]
MTRAPDETSPGETTPPDGASARQRWIVAAVVVGVAAFCAFVEASQNYVGSINFGRPVPYRESIRRTLPSWVIVALVAPGALYLARLFPLQRLRWKTFLAVHLAGASAFALAHLGGTALYYATVDNAIAKLPLMLNKFISAYFILDMLMYGGIVGAVHAWRYYREAKSRELAGVQLQESLTQARLAALRGQLNPHFLFNTLNAITTMALKREHDNVVVTLGYLSELLRVSLDDRLPQEVALANELELLDRYLEIQRIRFGDRLTVTQDVEQGALGALVPIMILQPLAENAIVHGIAPVTGPGELRLRASRQNGDLLLEVSDTGPGFLARVAKTGDAGPAPESDGNRSPGGIGLANTRARLTQLYGERFTLSVGDAPGGGARVQVTLPYRVAAEPNGRMLAGSGMS